MTACDTRRLTFFAFTNERERKRNRLTRSQHEINAIGTAVNLPAKSSTQREQLEGRRVLAHVRPNV